MKLFAFILGITVIECVYIGRMDSMIVSFE
jgi:hypothetical protein